MQERLTRIDQFFHRQQGSVQVQLSGTRELFEAMLFSQRSSSQLDLALQDLHLGFEVSKISKKREGLATFSLQCLFLELMLHTIESAEVLEEEFA